MASNDFHNALRPLEEAVALTRSGMVCLANPLAPEGQFGWEERPGMAKLRHQFWLWWRHGALAVACARAGARRVLIREFSNLPLLLWAPVFFPMRRRLHFVVNHNLQWAVSEGAERFAWRMLQRLGFRMVFFETRDLSLPSFFQLDHPRHCVIPHPVAPPSDAVGFRRAAPNTLPRVGVAGYARPEKEQRALIETLVAAGQGKWRVAVGTPDPTAHPPTLREAGVEVRTTASVAEYESFLRDCDVIALAPREDRYRFRPSGVLADAVSAGTPVVAPDFPLFRSQLRAPCAVGEIFSRPEELPAVVERALVRRAAGGYDFDAHRAARSPEAIARALDEIGKPASPRPATGGSLQTTAAAVAGGGDPGNQGADCISAPASPRPATGGSRETVAGL